MVEFTVQILWAFISNLRASLAYWKDISETGEDAQEKSKANKGFLKTWLNKDRLHLLFALLDTAEFFIKLQLKFQANQLTVLQIPQHKDIAIAQLTNLAGAPNNRRMGGIDYQKPQ